MTYIISLINTLPHHKYIYLIGKGGHSFSKEYAKTFDKPVVIRSNPNAILQLLVAQVDGLFTEEVFNNKKVHVILNKPENWQALKVKMTPNGLVKLNLE